LLGGGKIATPAAAVGASWLGAAAALPAAIGASIIGPAWSAYQAYQLNKANPKATPGSIYGGDGDMAFAAQWAENANDPTYRDFTLGSNKTFGRGLPSSFIPSSPSAFPGGSSSGTLDVTGQVTGQGEMTVKVEAGSSLLQAAE